MTTGATSCPRPIRSAEATVIATTSAARYCMTADLMRARSPASMPTMSSGWWSRSWAGSCPDPSSWPTALRLGGVPRRAHWCATPSSGWSFNPARFKSPGGQPQHPRPATPPDEDGDPRQVHAEPLPAPRPRARKEIIVPGGRDSPPRRLNQALILAIARAKSWMRDLRGGKYADTMDIARQSQLSDAHVRRILRFGYLAPDIVAAIVEGRQPRSLTVKRLLQGIPCAWADQRTAFGLAR